MTTNNIVYQSKTGSRAWKEGHPNQEVRTLLLSSPGLVVTLENANGVVCKWRIEPVPYYVNMGRWAGNIIGPFDTFHEADQYIDRCDWRGQRPTVVQIARPEK